uniref:Uncharacterized protein n=1 Tax=Cucumis sativus TaxID=3659 RepID=A0A0A0K837_CUCSA
MFLYKLITIICFSKDYSLRVILLRDVKDTRMTLKDFRKLLRQREWFSKVAYVLPFSFLLQGKVKKLMKDSDNPLFRYISTGIQMRGITIWRSVRERLPFF